MKRLVALFLLLPAICAIAAHEPYDEKADAGIAVKQALSDSAKSGKPVLLIFGANWCADCVSLDRALKKRKNAELMAGEFEIVKIDVGRFRHNLDLVEEYDEPIKRGIPAVVVVSPDNKILYTTKAGELASARQMSPSGIYDFFHAVVARIKSGG